MKNAGNEIDPHLGDLQNGGRVENASKNKEIYSKQTVGWKVVFRLI